MKTYLITEEMVEILGRISIDNGKVPTDAYLISIGVLEEIEPTLPSNILGI